MATQQELVIKKMKEWMLDMYTEATDDRIQYCNNPKLYEAGGVKIDVINELWKKLSKEFVY